MSIFIISIYSNNQIIISISFFMGTEHDTYETAFILVYTATNHIYLAITNSKQGVIFLCKNELQS